MESWPLNNKNAVTRPGGADEPFRDGKLAGLQVWRLGSAAILEYTSLKGKVWRFKRLGKGNCLTSGFGT